jgi:AAA domain-containing protein
VTAAVAPSPRVALATQREQLIALGDLMVQMGINSRETLGFAFERFRDPDIRQAVEELFESGRVDEPLRGVAAEAMQAYDNATVRDRIAARNRIRGVDASADNGDAPWSAVCAIDAPEPTPISWLIDGLWPSGELGMLFGDGGSFKTSIALHIAAAVAGGHRVFDRFATERGPVLFVSEEDPGSILQMRLEAFVIGHGWGRRGVLQNVHYCAVEGVTLTDARWQQRLRGEVERLGVRLVVLDPLTELVAGEENSASEMRPCIRFARSLCRPTGAAVMMLHHAGKAREGSRSIDRVRGSSAFYSASRAVYALEDRGSDTVAIECVKASRTARPRPFAVKREISITPSNRGQWRTARFTYVSPMCAAEEWLKRQLAEDPGPTTTQLRESAGKDRIPVVDLARAQKNLQDRGEIRYEGGQRGARYWYLTTLFSGSKQGEQGHLVDLVDPVGGTHNNVDAKTNADPSLYPLRGTSIELEDNEL